jgi:hypothetical protein
LYAVFGENAKAEQKKPGDWLPHQEAQMSGNRRLLCMQNTVNPVYRSYFQQLPQLSCETGVQVNTSRLYGSAFLRLAGSKSVGGESTWIAPFFLERYKRNNWQPPRTAEADPRNAPA